MTLPILKPDRVIEQIRVRLLATDEKRPYKGNIYDDASFLIKKLDDMTREFLCFESYKHHLLEQRNQAWQEIRDNVSPNVNHLRVKIKELERLLLHMVEQHCRDGNRKDCFDSLFISANENALDYCVDNGLIAESQVLR